MGGPAWGHADNNADLADWIPAGLQLPNLLAVGASDQAGEEAPFSTSGRTVVVHANGAEIDGPLPGGTRARLSGTSMASPQVANLAAKLIATKPQLTVAEVKAAILAAPSAAAASTGSTRGARSRWPASRWRTGRRLRAGRGRAVPVVGSCAGARHRGNVAR